MKIYQRYGKQVVAIAIIIILFSLARLPVLSAQEKEAIASQFNFTQLTIPTLEGRELKFQRAVHPSLQQHSAWISAVGAAIAFHDLDQDGLANDLCYVDTRLDQVMITPVPETGDRYPTTVILPRQLPYDQVTMAPMGCVPGDYNEDGQGDLLVYYWGRSPILFLNQNQGIGEYQEQELVTPPEIWNTNAATIADLDGDGHQDIIIGNYFQDGAEILNPQGTGTEAMQDSMTRAFNGGVNRIFLGQGTSNYTEAKGIFPKKWAQAWTLAIGAADLDGDQLPELYFANDFGPDRLLHNRSQPGKLAFALLEGEKKLNTPNSKVLGHDSFKGMGIDFGDLNSDGLLDMYVSNIAAEYALEESHFVFLSTGELEKINKGIAPYEDKSESLGLSRSSWSWETKFGDFNNDGVLEALQATGFHQGKTDRWAELQELALGNDQLLRYPGAWFQLHPGDDLSGHSHNPFFVKASDGRYYDLAKNLGIAQPLVTRGIATADVDGDGDLDWAIANQWQAAYFYRNDSPLENNFLGLRLKTVTDSPAIGATARVTLPNGQELVGQVDGGNGHSGVRSPEIHFGLGKIPSSQLVTVELAWRDTQGIPKQETVQLNPGWHTLYLSQHVNKE